MQFVGKRTGGLFAAILASLAFVAFAPDAEARRSANDDDNGRFSRGDFGWYKDPRFNQDRWGGRRMGGPDMRFGRPMGGREGRIPRLDSILRGSYISYL